MRRRLLVRLVVALLLAPVTAGVVAVHAAADEKTAPAAQTVTAAATSSSSTRECGGSLTGKNYYGAFVLWVEACEEYWTETDGHLAWKPVAVVHADSAQRWRFGTCTQYLAWKINGVVKGRLKGGCTRALIPGDWWEFPNTPVTHPFSPCASVQVWTHAVVTFDHQAYTSPTATYTKASPC